MSGFFAAANKESCVMDLFYGTDYHSHLGTSRGGIATVNENGFTRVIHNLENSYFRTKFESNLPTFSGKLGIGIISDLEPQPIIVNSHLGRFAVVTVGKICNQETLVAEMLAQNRHFSEFWQHRVNPVELVAMIITQGKTFEEGIALVQEKVQGSCSMLVLTEKGIYAARDKLGRTPIVIGKKDGGYAAASENCAFPVLDYLTDYFLGPGEIVLMTPDGWEQKKKPGKKMQICAFLWVYYGYPASDYENINVDLSRYSCGRALGRRDDVEADYVSGIPDSGVGHAIGYCHERKIPYARPFVKYTPTWPRSFMPQVQNMRDLVAKMKLITNRELIDGKRLVFCEDSIVRGTQLQEKVEVLNGMNAAEVHLRVACPPLCYPCEFHNFSTSRSALELASRRAIYELTGKDVDLDELAEFVDDSSDKHRAMLDQIISRIRPTSLKYQKLGDLIEAIGLPKEQVCTHCWDGTSYF